MARLPFATLLRLGPAPLITLAFAACLAPAASENRPPAQPTQWSGPYSATTAGTHRVLRDGPAWNAFWEEVGQAPPRAFDPGREMGIAVFLGERRRGGYGVRILSAAPVNGEFRVTYQETRPPAGAVVTQALSQPWALVVVPRSDLPVRAVPAAAPAPADR